MIGAASQCGSYLVCIPSKAVSFVSVGNKLQIDSVVYKTSYYRKQTKNHWARDDPAFAALEFIFLTISCIAYSISFRVPVTEGIAFWLYSVLFNWIGLGFIVATLGREMANRYLTDHKSSSHVRQSVEWLYAFDIHCNAFFPVFVLLCKYDTQYSK